MSYIYKYFGYIILGFFLLRQPFGTSFIATIYNYLIAIAFMFSCIQTMMMFPKLNKRTRMVYLYMIAMVVFLFISRMFNGYSFTLQAIALGGLQPIMLINFFLIMLTNDIWDKLRSIDFVLKIFIVINLATMILYPNGWYSNEMYDRNWFLGYKNIIIRTLLPALTINLIISFHEYGKYTIKNIILYAICFLTVFLSDSSTSLVMIIVFGLCVIGLPILIKTKFFNIVNSLVLLIILCIAILLYNVQTQYEDFIEQTLERNASFTNRTVIWEYSIGKILHSPLFGYGYHTYDEWTSIYNDFGLFTISHPHNFVLYQLIQGGVVYMIMYVILLVKIIQYTKDAQQQSEIYILTAMFFSFYVGGISESMTNCMFIFPMLGLYITINNNYQYEKNRYINNH